MIEPLNCGVCNAPSKTVLDGSGNALGQCRCIPRQTPERRRSMCSIKIHRDCSWRVERMALCQGTPYTDWSQGPFNAGGVPAGALIQIGSLLHPNRTLSKRPTPRYSRALLRSRRWVPTESANPERRFSRTPPPSRRSTRRPAGAVQCDRENGREVSCYGARCRSSWSQIQRATLGAHLCASGCVADGCRLLIDMLLRALLGFLEQSVPGDGRAAVRGRGVASRAVFHRRGAGGARARRSGHASRRSRGPGARRRVERSAAPLRRTRALGLAAVHRHHERVQSTERRDRAARRRLEAVTRR